MGMVLSGWLVRQVEGNGFGRGGVQNVFICCASCWLELPICRRHGNTGTVGRVRGPIIVFDLYVFILSHGCCFCFLALFDIDTPFEGFFGSSSWMG